MVTIMKALYIQPETKYQQVYFINSICIGSIRGNLDLDLVPDTGRDPI